MVKVQTHCTGATVCELTQLHLSHVFNFQKYEKSQFNHRKPGIPPSPTKCILKNVDETEQTIKTFLTSGLGPMFNIYGHLYALAFNVQFFECLEGKAAHSYCILLWSESYWFLIM